MKNLFRENEARRLVRKLPSYPEELIFRLYTSRLIGTNQDLVLHGGGNTSVKLKARNIVGEDQEVLFRDGVTALRRARLQRITEEAHDQGIDLTQEDLAYQIFGSGHR